MTQKQNKDQGTKTNTTLIKITNAAEKLKCPKNTSGIYSRIKSLQIPKREQICEGRMQKHITKT